MDKGYCASGGVSTTQNQPSEMVGGDPIASDQDHPAVGESFRFFGRWLDDWKRRNEGVKP